MTYTLQTARSELKRALPWLTMPVEMVPLEGLADGLNTLFHLPIVPAVEGATIALFDGAGNAVVGSTVLSYEGGALRTALAPIAPLYVSYTAQALSDAKLLGLVQAGYDEMQSRLRRTLYLVEADGASHISSDPVTPTDPVAGDIGFSQSRTQIDFLLACCEYTLLKALSVESALAGFSYREERMGGLHVDKIKQPASFKDLLVLADAKVEEKLWAAAEEMGEGSFGAFIPGAQSDAFAATMAWWPASRQARGL